MEKINFLTEAKMSANLLYTDDNQLKEFQCPVCLKNFTRKFTLDMHLLIHKGVKPHPCPFCGKHFRQKGTLMRHKALHSVNNLFHCSLCDRGFRQKNVFLHHLKHRHQVSTETLDRRKYRTELKDYQSIMDTLPPFVSADSTAIASSEKHLDAMLYESFNNNVYDSSMTENFAMINNSKSSLERHSIDNSGVYTPLQGDHMPQELSYKCVICLKIFSDYVLYEKHVEEEHDNEEILLDSKPIITQSSTQSLYNISVSSSKKITSFSEETFLDADMSPKGHFQDNQVDQNTSSSVLSVDSIDICSPHQKDYPFKQDSECVVNSNTQTQFQSEMNSKSINIFGKNAKILHGNSSHKSTSVCTQKINNCATAEKRCEFSCKNLFQRKKGMSSTSDNISMARSAYLKNSLKPTQNFYINPAFSKSGDRNSKLVNIHNPLVRPEHINKNVKWNKTCSVSSMRGEHFQCLTCSIRFRCRSIFEYHKQMHLNSFSFACIICKKRFSSKQLLLSHTRSMHLKIFKCTSCHRVFHYRTIYDHHIKRCSLQSVKSFKQETFSFPVIDINSLDTNRASGLVGVIPLSNVQNGSEMVIPIMSLEGISKLKANRALKSLEVGGFLKDNDFSSCIE